MFNLKVFSKISLLAYLSLQATACTTMGKALNPFHEEPPKEAYYGELNDKAISGAGKKIEVARGALESMGSYRQAQTPEPTYPVLQPAVIRLLWVPDHQNKYGDLVPAHYYYLKVLDDRLAVQDRFELEQQLGDKNSGSNVPFVNKGEYQN
jgi:hypothetical protein